MPIPCTRGGQQLGVIGEDEKKTPRTASTCSSTVTKDKGERKGGESNGASSNDSSVTRGLEPMRKEEGAFCGRRQL